MSSWTTIEDAIQAWVSAATSITGAKCVWMHQDISRLSKPFVTLLRSGGQALALQDAKSATLNPGRNPSDASTDLILKNIPFVEFTVSVQAFAAPVDGDNAAFRLLDLARNALMSELQSDAFAVAGVAVIDRGTVQNISAILETHWESRAQLTVRFRASDVTQQTYYSIATVPYGFTFNP